MAAIISSAAATAPPPAISQQTPTAATPPAAAERPLVQFHAHGVDLLLQEDPSLGIPGHVWECGRSMATYVASSNSSKTTDVSTSSGASAALPFPHHFFKGKRVMELGAGTGIVGIAAAKLGADVWLTDLDEVLPLLQANVTLNQESTSSPTTMTDDKKSLPPTIVPGRMSVARLQWGLDTAAAFQPPFDIVLMSDVVYADYADRTPAEEVAFRQRKEAKLAAAASGDSKRNSDSSTPDYNDDAHDGFDRSFELHSWDPGHDPANAATVAPIQAKNFNGLLDLMKQLAGPDTLLIMAHITRHPSEGSFFAALARDFVFTKHTVNNCQLLADDHADPRMTIYHIHSTRVAAAAMAAAHHDPRLKSHLNDEASAQDRELTDKLRAKAEEKRLKAAASATISTTTTTSSS